MDGILLIDKPSGISSHGVVARARRVLGIKKIGHAGTLDPLATGLLILLVGKGTKLSDQFIGFDKAYQSTLRLGLRTDSADLEGEVLEEKDFSKISEKDLCSAFEKFTGEIEQLPPMYSAVKYKGKKLYELARKGIEIERKPRQVRIDALKLLNFQSPDAEFLMECSKGTYVRQLVDDVGQELGCGATTTQIRRTKIGSFCIEDAIQLDDIHESHIQSITDITAFA